MNYENCIEACHACLVACEHCAASCLSETEVQKMARCIALDHSCADICAIAVREMARSSHFAAAICQVCATACDTCGEECAKHQKDHCQACAEACRRCAEECRKMAA